jgi:hypothetical protein
VLRPVLSQLQEEQDVQVDHIKSGIVKYGVKTWSQAQLGHRRSAPTRLDYSDFRETTCIFFSGNVSATSGIVILAEPTILFDDSAAATFCIVEPQPQVVAVRAPVNPILEMRSARRSLRDKAQEVMSDFEREYPW